MSFFEPPPPPSALAQAKQRPAWLAPPANVLPGVVPVELLLARTEQTAVAVTGIRAYPTGFAFTISIRLRHHASQQQTGSGHGMLAMLDYFEPSGRVFLRLGVRFADGRVASVTIDGSGTELTLNTSSLGALSMSDVRRVM